MLTYVRNSWQPYCKGLRKGLRKGLHGFGRLVLTRFEIYIFATRKYGLELSNGGEISF